MSNFIKAITLISALTELSMRAMQAQRQAVQMIQKAQEEGRDVTDDELKQIQSQREQTMQQWRDLA